MDLIRVDTDYAMRMLVGLALHARQGPVTVRELAESQDISADFAHKILRKLHRAGLAGRRLGSRGGFALAREPEAITLWDVAQAVQGPLAVRKCCLGIDNCPRSSSCAIQPKMAELQDTLSQSLKDITLAGVLHSRHPGPAAARRSRGGGKTGNT